MPSSWAWVPVLVALLGLCCEVVKVYGAQRAGGAPGWSVGCQAVLTGRPPSALVTPVTDETSDLRYALLATLVADADASRTALRQVGVLAEIVQTARDLQAEAARAAALEGATWAGIGRAAGLSKQSAWHRWHPSSKRAQPVR